ncbi:hypothetical protein [Luteipulveratus mongoliensis]|uniref:DUF8017 domain-containing protein n=1 Tax=Luteipulveratus mongoliensis TaxID=571913 RepID=A0A0K1JMV1_9MICO|nr:hypothetical protein [Luteipulveratus mongoliensis]AKU18047.1 hypothetical protein VV02_22915 [Luteipulveratus mongoliensis]
MPDYIDRWAKAFSLQKDKKTLDKYTPATVKQIKVNGGQTDAVQARTTITVTNRDPKKCPPPKFELVVTSFTSGTNTATVVAGRDVGTPNAIPDDVFAKIIASSRPIP